MANVFDMIDTWNAAGTTFTAIKMNVTDTASAAASLLMDLQVGGASKFRVGKGGNIGLYGDAPDASYAAYSPSASGGFHSLFSLNNSGTIGWADAFFSRDAANILAQRNGVNAQAFRLYNTYTDAANYERGKFAWNANVLEIGAERAGTGANRDVSLQASGTLFLSTVGTTRWNVSTGGHFLAQADNTYDIGAVGAMRPRNLFLGSYQQMTEMTAPAAPAANNVRIFAQDNGAGKTQLMAIFGSGAAVQIAIEP